MNIKEELINVVSPILPIGLFDYNGDTTKQYATFFIVNESKGLNADNKEVLTSYTIQLDIYSKGNLEPAYKEVLKALEDNDFSREGALDLFEPESKTYRKVLTIKAIRETTTQ